MAILKAKDIIKMNEKEITDKMKELKIELIKAQIAGKKGGKSNAREIRRTIAKLLTVKRQNEIKNKPMEAKK